MCVYIQEAIYDEDLAIALIDSSAVEEVATKLIALNLDYQNLLDVFLLANEPRQKYIDSLNAISKELASYRKALQVLVG